MNASSFPRRFARALLDPAAATPAELLAWNGSDPAKRLAVYRNNVVVSLIDALSAKFPVVNALVGEDFFAAMARAYIAADPPRSPILALYGDRFGEFTGHFEPARELPYLADVARLEVMQLRAYHAADARAFGPNDFAALDADDLDEMVVRLHPSIGLMESDYAVFSLWAAHNGLAEIGAVDPFVPESALVARPKLEVETTRLGPGEAAFFATLARGLPLWRAAATALERSVNFDLTRAINVLVVAGVTTSIFKGEGIRP